MTVNSIYSLDVIKKLKFLTAMPPKKYSVFSADIHPWRWLEAWYRLPLGLATLLMAAPLLVALWAMVWTNLEIQTQSRQQEENVRVTRASQLSTESLKTLLVSADLVLLELRRYWLNKPHEFFKVLESRHDKLQLGTDFDVFVVDASGKVVKSTSPAHVIRDNLHYIPPMSRHQADTKDRLFLGPAFFDNITERWQLPFTRRLLSASGKFVGIMVFLVPPEYFNTVLEATNLQNGSIFSIVDLTTGDVILRNAQVNDPTDAQPESVQSEDFWSFLNLGIPKVDAGDMVNQLPPPISKVSASSLVKLQVAPHNGLKRNAFSIDHIERLNAWNKLDRIPLVVTVGTPASDLDKLLAIHRLRHILTGTAFSLLVLTLAAGFNRYDRSRRQSRQALAASEQDLRQLAAHQTDLLEEERKFIAREIHDDLGQRLSVLRLDLAMLMKTMQSNCSIDLLPRAEQVKDAIDDLLRLTRDLAKKVRPPSLEIGFLPAVEALCDEFLTRLPIQLNFVNNTEQNFQPDDACAIAAYRILQECLANASRHAQCQHIHVSLAVHEDWLYLRVVDDGIGFDPKASHTGRRTFGLLGMRERVAALHGEMRLQSQAGQGCKIVFMLPLNSTAADFKPLIASQ